MNAKKIILNRRWEIKTEVALREKTRFCEHIERFSYIAESVQRLNDTLQDRRQIKAYPFKKAARDMSNYIRIIFDDMFFQTFVMFPKLHPFRIPKIVGPPDVFVESHGGMTLHYESKGISESETSPSYEHRTVLKSLYGLEKVDEKQYKLSQLLNTSFSPIKYKHWLKSDILQVGKTKLNAGEIINLLRNKEGAHLESNDLPLSLSLPIDITHPDIKMNKYLVGNIMSFGGLSYLQIFTILLGIYLTQMIKATLQYLPDEITKCVVDASSVILEAPDFDVPQLIIDVTKQQWSIGSVFDNTVNGLVPVGDYSKPGKTVIQIP